MIYCILFRRHETSKARGIGINLCVQSDRKEKGRALIVFVEGPDSSRSSKSTQHSDHYYCTVNRAMDAVRLSKEHVQGSRHSVFALGGVPDVCSTVAGSSVYSKPHVC